MFEVDVLNLETNKRFTKIFNDSINAWKFVRKVNFSKKLQLICVTDYSYMFD